MKRAAIRSIPTAKLTIPIGGRDHIQGPIDAPMKLVEYGDFECPYCGEAHGVIKAVQQELNDRLCFAYRHFPLANIHPHAARAAEAAEAAGAQGNFWGMHDLLFENQDALEDEDLAEYAALLGLDANRLLSEMDAGFHRDRVQQDFKSGVRSGVNGTPTLFVNGYRYDGDRSPEGLLAAFTEIQ